MCVSVPIYYYNCISNNLIGYLLSSTSPVCIFFTFLNFNRHFYHCTGIGGCFQGLWTLKLLSKRFVLKSCFYFHCDWIIFFFFSLWEHDDDGWFCYKYPDDDIYGCRLLLLTWTVFYSAHTHIRIGGNFGPALAVSALVMLCVCTLRRAPPFSLLNNKSLPSTTHLSFSLPTRNFYDRYIVDRYGLDWA
jgi:hypothetical protein